MSVTLPLDFYKKVVKTRIDSKEATQYDRDFLDGKITLEQWQDFEKNKVTDIKIKKEIKKQEESKKLVKDFKKNWKIKEAELKKEGVLATDKNTAEILLFSGLGVIALVIAISYFKNK